MIFDLYDKFSVHSCLKIVENEWIIHLIYVVLPTKFREVDYIQCFGLDLPVLYKLLSKF